MFHFASFSRNCNSLVRFSRCCCRRASSASRNAIRLSPLAPLMFYFAFSRASISILSNLSRADQRPELRTCHCCSFLDCSFERDCSLDFHQDCGFGDGVSLPEGEIWFMISCISESGTLYIIVSTLPHASIARRQQSRATLLWRKCHERDKIHGRGGQSLRFCL